MANNTFNDPIIGSSYIRGKNLETINTTTNGSQVRLLFSDRSNSVYGLFWAGRVANKGGRLFFGQYSENSSGSLLSYREQYCLPSPSAGLTANKTYDILTSKQTRIFTGTCSTAAGTADKGVTLTDSQTYVLTAGDVAFIRFTNTNTASVANLTLSINSSEKKPIKRYYNNGLTTIPNTNWLQANYTYMFVYDGTNWVVNMPYNSTYTQIATNASIGFTSIPTKALIHNTAPKTDTGYHILGAANAKTGIWSFGTWPDSGYDNKTGNEFYFIFSSDTGTATRRTFLTSLDRTTSKIVIGAGADAIGGTTVPVYVKANGEATAISNLFLGSNSTSHTTSHYMYVASDQGQIGFYSNAGSGRGLWVRTPSGTGSSVMTIDSSDVATFKGSLNGNAYSASNLSIHNTKECSIGSSTTATNTSLWINFRSASDGTTTDGASILSNYYFCNRKGQYGTTTLYAGTFNGNATGLTTAPTLTNGGTSPKALSASTTYTLTVGGKTVAFTTPADANTKVKQNASTTNAEYKILTTTTASPTSGTAYETNYASGVTLNPYKSSITAAKFFIGSTAVLFDYGDQDVGLNAIGRHLFLGTSSSSTQSIKLQRPTSCSDSLTCNTSLILAQTYIWGTVEQMGNVANPQKGQIFFVISS